MSPKTHAQVSDLSERLVECAIVLKVLNLHLDAKKKNKKINKKIKGFKFQSYVLLFFFKSKFRKFKLLKQRFGLSNVSLKK